MYSDMSLTAGEILQPVAPTFVLDSLVAAIFFQALPLLLLSAASEVLCVGREDC